MKMKAVFLLFLFCLAEADDLRYEVKAMFQQLKSELEAQNADMASRLSASEAKTGELQTRLDQLQTSYDQFQDSHNLVTKEQDCLKRKLCEQHGFTYGDGLCYYISTEEKTWDESRQWCIDRQSDLIVIKSQEKQDLVASFNKRIWLGLTDKVTEGIFQWVDGTPLTSPTYWKSGEPEGERERRDPAKGWYLNAEEDCVEYYDGSHSSSSVRGWNDNPCSIWTNYWMCERAVC